MYYFNEFSVFFKNTEIKLHCSNKILLILVVTFNNTTIQYEKPDI